VPLGSADIEEHEGGQQDDDKIKEVHHGDKPNRIIIRVPVLPKHNTHGSKALVNSSALTGDHIDSDTNVSYTPDWADPQTAVPTSAQNLNLLHQIKLPKENSIMPQPSALLISEIISSNLSRGTSALIP